MFLRLVADSFSRRPRHKLLTGAALALGMAVATAALSVSLDVGDRLAREFRSLGANLVVTPQADSLPLEIGGVDYRPANSAVLLPESDLPKIKTVFWHNNIIAFAPRIEVQAEALSIPSANWIDVLVIGTWAEHRHWPSRRWRICDRGYQNQPVVENRRSLVFRAGQGVRRWSRIREKPWHQARRSALPLGRSSHQDPVAASGYGNLVVGWVRRQCRHCCAVHCSRPSSFARPISPALRLRLNQARRRLRPTRSCHDEARRTRALELLAVRFLHSVLDSGRCYLVRTCA